MKKLIFIIAALAMITGSAYAADWNFYGSARVMTWWDDVDAGDGTSATNVNMGLQGNARIGANVAVSDELSGRFEYGAGGGNANIRLLYGTWNFGAGTLRIGQDYTPLYLPVSNQAYNADYGLGGYGEPYPGRKAQIKLKMGGFEIALVQPNATYTSSAVDATASFAADALGQVALGAGYAAAIAADPTLFTVLEAADNTEIQIPAIQAAYKFAQDNWNIAAGFGWQTFEETTISKSVNSYVVTLRGGVSFGAITLGAELFGGQNAGNLVAIDVNGADTDVDKSGAGYAAFDGTNIIDNDVMGYEIVAGYTVNDMFGLEIGYGYVETEYDMATSTKDKVSSYYISAPITLAPGVFIVPEYGVFDFKEDVQGDITYFGAKWQINF